MKIHNIKRKFPQWILIYVLLGMGFFYTGCAVPQWQREHLSDPIMRFDGEEGVDNLELHVLPLKEGSAGGHGASGGGGGCGC